ncbi:MAG TPA: hypothetical protein VK745_23635 [Polyangiaceae bacterium]|nr:hypothetical protein [Polyangiaceae bacterium]
MTRRPNRLRPRAVARSLALRVCALFVALLTLSAQQRVIEIAPLVAASESRIVPERSPRVESAALRVEAPLRVARAPLLTRLPLAATFFTASRSPLAYGVSPRAERAQRARVTTHFHAKRRIPRMNSEEPPRA